MKVSSAASTMQHWSSRPQLHPVHSFPPKRKLKHVQLSLCTVQSQLPWCCLLDTVHWNLVVRASCRNWHHQRHLVQASQSWDLVLNIHQVYQSQSPAGRKKQTITWRGWQRWNEATSPGQELGPFHQPELRVNLSKHCIINTFQYQLWLYNQSAYLSCVRYCIVLSYQASKLSFLHNGQQVHQFWKSGGPASFLAVQWSFSPILTKLHSAVYNILVKRKKLRLNNC